MSDSPKLQAARAELAIWDRVRRCDVGVNVANAKPFGLLDLPASADQAAGDIDARHFSAPPAQLARDASVAAQFKAGLARPGRRRSQGC